jgi:hypothetical protein
MKPKMMIAGILLIILSIQPVMAENIKIDAQSSYVQAVAVPEIAGPPPIYIEVKPLTKEPKLGEPVDIEVSLEKSAGVEWEGVNYPQPWGDWVIVSRQTGSPNKKSDGTWQRQDRLKLMTYMDGKVEIPSLTVKFISKDHQPAEFKSSVIYLNVLPKVNKKGQVELSVRDIKKPIWMISIWQILLALLIAVIILTIIWWFFRKSVFSDLGVRKEPARPPDEIALERLDKLNNSDLIARGEFKLFYIELSDILRRYLEGRYSISALDRTTPELMREIKGILSRQDVAGTRDFLDRSDMIKFAKALPDSKELNQDLNLVKDLIIRTTQIAVEEAELKKLKTNGNNHSTKEGKQ